MLKEIIVKANTTFRIRILVRSFGAAGTNFDFNPIYTIQRFQHLLFTLNNLNICNDLRFLSVLGGRFDFTVCRDLGRTWRHVRCSLLLSMTSICPFCKRARETVTTRLRKIQKRRNIPKNIRLQLSPKKKRIFAKLRKKCRAVEKAKIRAHSKLAELKSKLDKCQQKMSMYSESSLDNYLKSAELPQN